MSIRPHASPPLALLVVLASTAAHAQIQDTRRPPPLEKAPECELWKGKVSGNDPSVEVEMRLCAAAGDEVTGVFQWSSLRSGWNRRALVGRWSDGRTKLALRDASILEERPQPGWRFCTVDDYDLTLTAPGALDGTYRSKACNDTAKVNLKLEGPATAPATAPPPAPPPPAPPAAPSAPPAETKSRGLCSFAPPGGPRPVPAIALLAGAVLAGVRRRRRLARGHT